MFAMSKRIVKSLASIALLFVVLPISALGQEEVQKRSKVQDDLEFAMEMARYRYFDLANEYVEQVKRGRMTPEDQATLLLTNAQVLRWAAEFSSNRAERAKFYDEAIVQFKEFTEYNTDHPDFNRARIDLAVLYQSHGQFVKEEKEATEVPEQRDELKTSAESSFREATLMFNDVARELRKRYDVYLSDGQEDEANRTMRQALEAEYKKGVAFYSWALIYDEGDFNRGDYLQRTIDTLDEYIWQAPENDFWTLWAYLYQSKAYLELGEYVQALDMAKQITDPDVGISLEDPEKKKLDESYVDLAPEFLKLITDLVESAYMQQALIHNEQSDYDTAVAAIGALSSIFERCGLTMSQIGDRAVLVQADAYLQLGKVDLAAEVAKDVSDRNAGNRVGDEAKVFIQKLLASAPTGSAAGKGADSITISPDIFYAAAEGAKLEQKYHQAIKAYYRVFDALKTVDQEKDYIAKIWYSIGQCYDQLRRPLEASVAFKAGFFSQFAKADEDLYDRNGNNWYLATSKRFKETQHSYDEAIMKTARETLVNAGVKTDLLYFIAKEKFDRAQTAKDEERTSLVNDAIDSFRDVKKTSVYYEKSLIYLARCHEDLGKHDEALKRLDEFDRFVRTSPPPATPKQKGARQGALAEAIFYRAEIYLTQEKFEEAFKLLDGFEFEYDTQQGFFAAIIFFRLRAKIGMEDYFGAEKLFEEMKAKYQSSSRFPVAAYRLGKEFAQAAEKVRGNPEEEPSRKYIDYLRKGAEYMFQYCELSSFDSYINLKNVADWYKELKDFSMAKDVYLRLIKEFLKDPQYTAEIEETIYRSYGDVLLELRDFQNAKPVWIKLLNNDNKNPSILRSTAFCLGGWLEKDGDNYIEIPGSGDYVPPPGVDTSKIRLDNALGIWKFLLRRLKVNKAYEPEWWDAKLQTIYCYYMAGQNDAACYATGLKLIANVELYHPDLGGYEKKRAFKYLQRAIKEKQRQR